MNQIRWMIVLVGCLLVLAEPLGAEEPRLGPEAAVARAIRHNLGLRTDRLAPELSAAPRQLAASNFDTVLYGSVEASTSYDGPFRGSIRPPSVYDFGFEAAIGLRRRFLSGTSLDFRLGGGLSLDSDDTAGRDPRWDAAATLSLRHPLLRGSGNEVNRVEITVADLARRQAEATLSRRAEVVASDTLKAYWDLYAAMASLRIQELSLKMSQTTLAETLTLIQAQKLAQSEEVSVKHQVKTQERAVLLAEQTLADARDRLARQLGDEASKGTRTPAYSASLGSKLTPPTEDLATLQKVALEHRGDYQAAKIAMDSRRLQERTTRNLLLPQLDLTGSVSAGTYKGLVDLATGYDAKAAGTITLGLTIEFPLGNREAKARAELASLATRRAEMAAEIQVQTIAEDLKVAFRAVKSAEALVKLSLSAVEVAETKLKNEQDLYRAGKSSARMLFLVQTDLTQERLGLEQAQATFHKALVDLWAACGSLLPRLGLSARP